VRDLEALRLAVPGIRWRSVVLAADVISLSLEVVGG
jgi:hypothetical protein